MKRECETKAIAVFNERIAVCDVCDERNVSVEV